MNAPFQTRTCANRSENTLIHSHIHTLAHVHTHTLTHTDRHAHSKTHTHSLARSFTHYVLPHAKSGSPLCLIRRSMLFLYCVEIQAVTYWVNSTCCVLLQHSSMYINIHGRAPEPTAHRVTLESGCCCGFAQSR